MRDFVVFSEEVARALEERAPIVALETTILSHGMPYPQNVETALAVEAIVREEGCVPATIAVVCGRIHVGLTHEQLEHFGTAQDVLKLSRADLPYAVAAGKDGATTVAATMLCAHLAGIEVFATGGVGGVHRGAERTMDVSADLEELARTSVAVVCAGVKALLDLPKTLEVLETRGVPVVGYATAEFPAFWSRSSGLAVPLRFDAPEEIANFLRVKRSLQIESGTLVANPIPYADEIPAAQMRGYIETAVQEAAQANVTGKAVTPWLLDRILRLSGGRSLTANVALVKNNARLAARIARSLA
ncbi:MAG TPA: pseudouridine-5'-phosphate glycosidase [Candidatus Baltobacteraceae bacterium]|nr:pseudouridine-5'-phosphate glycosidase [Candidatus Baltobacteraceae bacterium]